MNDDIIRMAREAGSIDSEEVIETVWRAFSAAEREACAVAGGAAADAGLDVAAAIRARAQQPDAAIADRLARHGIPMPGDPK